MGTPEFAVPTLDFLATEGYNIVAVVTAPDRPAGRGMKLQPSAVKSCALKHGLPILQPEKFKNEAFLDELKSYEADLQIVVAFRMLPEVVWDMPKLGTFNLHGSLLPQYRGAAPVNWAVINGDEESGITTFFIKHEIDTGDIILQEKTLIGSEDTAGDLYERLMSMGPQLVAKTVDLIATGNYKLQVQDLSKPTSHAPKINKESAKIDFSKTNREINNLIRGMSPYPAAWTLLDGKILKIFKAKPAENYQGDSESEYYTDGKQLLTFPTADGAIEVEVLQLEGKKKMTIEDFLRGNKL